MPTDLRNMRCGVCDRFPCACPPDSSPDLSGLLRDLRDRAAECGDMATAYRHERRLQILVGMPPSFVARRPPSIGQRLADRISPAKGLEYRLAAESLDRFPDAD